MIGNCDINIGKGGGGDYLKTITLKVSIAVIERERWRPVKCVTP